MLSLALLLLLAGGALGPGGAGSARSEGTNPAEQRLEMIRILRSIDRRLESIERALARPTTPGDERPAQTPPREEPR